jgi:DNA-directed RNA polymerase specialized sigma24 family protein
MERLEVFDKWDITKIDAEKQDKKIEQFLFKNIESILYKEYHDRRKRTLRFKRLASVDNIHRDTYSTERKEIFTDDLCPDLTDLDMVTDTQKKDAQALKDKAHSTFKRYPTTNDIPAMCSEKYQSPSEALEEKDILNMILNSCKNETEAKIVALKLKGMEHTEIAASCNCTYPQVSQYLSKIKGRYISNAAKANKLQKA